MAEIGTIALTMADWAKRVDPDGSTANVVELTTLYDDILKMLPYVQGNSATYHRTTVRVDQPGVTYTIADQGVIPGKSTTAQVDETFGVFEALSHIPKRICELNGNTAEFRMSEAKPFIRAMTEEALTAMFYHDSSLDPEKPLGLAPRYNSLLTSNVIDAGGGAASAITSMWMMVIGENTFHGIFPKGSKVGLQHSNEGLIKIGDDTNGYRYVYSDHYEWTQGFCLRDWHYVCRICNINASVTATSGTITPELMAIARGKMPDLRMGRPLFVCHGDLETQLSILAMNKSNAAFGIADIFGQPITTFWGIPIIRCDSISIAEDPVV